MSEQRKPKVPKLNKFGELESAEIENEVDFEGQKTYTMEWDNTKK